MSIQSQPTAQEPMAVHRDPFYKRALTKISTKEGWFGTYDYGYLCKPQWPYGKKGTRKTPPFYGLHADLPLLLAIVCGFQHSLAMLAGVITPPIIFASQLALPRADQSYLISASLISSGILSMIQMSRFRIPKTRFYIGTGLITVVGTSFASISTGTAVFNALYADGTCPSTRDAAGAIIRQPCPEAYGKLLGTFMVTSFFLMGLSFVPPTKLRKMFPPLVTGITIVMIGVSLIGKSGFLNWGGGTNACASRPAAPSLFALCPSINAKHALKWGSAQYLGLGFLSFVTIILVEIFGSPFMRNASIILGLVMGMIVAGATGYVDPSNIKTAPAITFLWVRRFKLSVYGPAVLPSLAVYVVLAMEAIGDITASADLSGVEVEGPEFDSRIQGGVLADGMAGLFSTLFTVTPMSIFAQNNGVIALTRCANRRAGYICASFMVLYGVLGKLSGVFLSIPNPVLGGVTTFLFGSVVAAGIKIISYIPFTRKNRFILAASGALGFGNMLVPTWATFLFADVNSPGAGLQGFFNSIIIIISTPYLIAGLTASILNAILPDDPPEQEPIEASPSFTDASLELGTRGSPRTEEEKDEDYKGVEAEGSRNARVQVLNA